MEKRRPKVEAVPTPDPRTAVGNHIGALPYRIWYGNIVRLARVVSIRYLSAYGIESTLEEVFDSIEGDVAFLRVDDGEEEERNTHQSRSNEHAPLGAEPLDLDESGTQDDAGDTAACLDDIVSVCLVRADLPCSTLLSKNVGQEGTGQTLCRGQGLNLMQSLGCWLVSDLRKPSNPL